MKKVVRGESYDDSSEEAILQYAKTLEGKTLRELLDIPEEVKPKGYTPAKVNGKQGNKGAMGDNVEELFFDIRNNNDQAPDFIHTQLELKTTGLVYSKKDKSMRAKERLAITNINYMKILDEDFETSHFLDKASKILLLAYDYRDDTDNVFDMRFQLAAIWGIPDSDIPQIRKDWETVIEKVRAGKAHEISGRDTLYLEAATTGSGHGKTVPQPNSDIPAKPRRWMLKSSYMTAVLNSLFDKKDKYEAISRTQNQETLDLKELVRERFKPYFGLSRSELKKTLNIQYKESAKQFLHGLTKQILGVSSNAEITEFKKANVTTKTIRLNSNGRLQESISFPAFKWTTIAETPWEESDFYKNLQTPFLFVVFKDRPIGDGKFEPYLYDIVWWSCPDDTLAEAEEVYNDTRRKVLRGDYEHFAPITGLDGNGSRIHVRPHGRNSSDTYETPQGGAESKKAFWLTNHYVKEIIDESHARYKEDEGAE